MGQTYFLKTGQVVIPFSLAEWLAQTSRLSPLDRQKTQPLLFDRARYLSLLECLGALLRSSFSFPVISKIRQPSSWSSSSGKNSVSLPFSWNSFHKASDGWVQRTLLCIEKWQGSKCIVQGDKYHFLFSNWIDRGALFCHIFSKTRIQLLWNLKLDGILISLKSSYFLYCIQYTQNPLQLLSLFNN